MLPIGAFLLTILLGALGSLPISDALGDEVLPRVDLLRLKSQPRASAGKASLLQWVDPKPPILVEPSSNGASAVFALMRGKVGKLASGESFVCGDVSIDAASDEDLEIKLRLVGQVTELECLLVDAQGGTRSEIHEVVVEHYAELSAPRRPAILTARAWSLNSGLGLSLISYSDPRIAAFSERGLTWKVNAGYALPGRPWEIGFTGFMTVFVMGSNTGESAKFIGLNLRGGYAVPAVKAPWHLSLLFGFYYVTMSVSSERFGFKNMSGPQVFPVLRRDLGNGGSVAGYLKFSPVASSFALLSIYSYEFAYGLSYSHPLKSGKRIGVSLDVANLQLYIQNALAKSSSISLGGSYSF